MNAIERKLMRIELLKQRNATANRRSQERKALRSTGEQPEVRDEGDLSALDLVTGLDAALLQLRGEAMVNIDNALQRLDDGTYGVCEDCGEEIPAARLRAVPVAERCRSCEEMCESDRRASYSHVGRQTFEAQDSVYN